MYKLLKNKQKFSEYSVGSVKLTLVMAGNLDFASFSLWLRLHRGEGGRADYTQQSSEYWMTATLEQGHCQMLQGFWEPSFVNYHAQIPNNSALESCWHSCSDDVLIPFPSAFICCCIFLTLVNKDSLAACSSTCLWSSVDEVKLEILCECGENGVQRVFYTMLCRVGISCLDLMYVRMFVCLHVPTGACISCAEAADC